MEDKKAAPTAPAPWVSVVYVVIVPLFFWCISGALVDGPYGNYGPIAPHLYSSTYDTQHFDRGVGSDRIGDD